MTISDTFDSIVRHQVVLFGYFCLLVGTVAAVALRAILVRHRTLPANLEFIERENKYCRYLNDFGAQRSPGMPIVAVVPPDSVKAARLYRFGLKHVVDEPNILVGLIDVKKLSAVAAIAAVLRFMHSVLLAHYFRIKSDS